MKEVNENINDTELELDDLSEVNGGLADKSPALAGSSSIVAYCKSCGNKLWVSPEPVKRNGGLTHIFKCTNTKCKEYNKEKTNIEVRWP